jgi:hypothetical protein
MLSYKYYYVMTNHYMICERIDYKKREDCGRKLLVDNDRRKCNAKRVNYRLKKAGQNVVVSKSVKEKEKINY